MNQTTLKFLQDHAGLIKLLLQEHDLVIPLFERGEAVFRAAQIWAYLQQHPGLSYQELADHFDLHPDTIRHYVRALSEAEVATRTSSRIAPTKKRGRPHTQVHSIS